MPRIIVETRRGGEIAVHGAQDYFILDYSLLERDECPICHLRPMSGEVPEEFIFRPGKNDRICPQCDINWNNCAWMDIVIRIDEVLSNE